MTDQRISITNWRTDAQTDSPPVPPSTLVLSLYVRSSLPSMCVNGRCGGAETR
jgi:hypothetical protein